MRASRSLDVAIAETCKISKPSVYLYIEGSNIMSKQFYRRSYYFGDVVVVIVRNYLLNVHCSLRNLNAMQKKDSWTAML